MIRGYHYFWKHPCICWILLEKSQTSSRIFHHFPIHNSYRDCWKNANPLWRNSSGRDYALRKHGVPNIWSFLADDGGMVLAWVFHSFFTSATLSSWWFQIIFEGCVQFDKHCRILRIKGVETTWITKGRSWRYQSAIAVTFFRRVIKLPSLNERDERDNLTSSKVI